MSGILDCFKVLFQPLPPKQASVIPIKPGTVMAPKPIETVSPLKPPPSEPGVLIVGKALEVDIYHGDGPIDFSAMKAEGRVSRVYVKASQYHIDQAFRKYVQDAHAAGLLVGAYHFLNCSEDGKAQGLMFLEAIKGLENELELPPCCDWEDGSAQGMSSAHQQAVADAFIEVVEAGTSRTCEIYGGESFLRDLNLPAKYARHPLWLAHYQTTITRLHIPAPWTKLAGWQYSDSEHVAGKPGGIDASWVAG